MLHSSSAEHVTLPASSTPGCSDEGSGKARTSFFAAKLALDIYDTHTVIKYDATSTEETATRLRDRDVRREGRPVHKRDAGAAQRRAHAICEPSDRLSVGFVDVQVKHLRAEGAQSKEAQLQRAGCDCGERSGCSVHSSVVLQPHHAERDMRGSLQRTVFSATTAATGTMAHATGAPLKRALTNTPRSAPKAWRARS